MRGFIVAVAGRDGMMVLTGLGGCVVAGVWSIINESRLSYVG